MKFGYADAVATELPSKANPREAKAHALMAGRGRRAERGTIIASKTVRVAIGTEKCRIPIFSGEKIDADVKTTITTNKARKWSGASLTEWSAAWRVRTKRPRR